VRLPAFAMRGSTRLNPHAISGFLVFFVYAADKAAGYVVSGDLAELAYVALGFVGCAFVVGMLNNWHNGLYFFLAWLVFEDLARKFLGNNMFRLPTLAVSAQFAASAQMAPVYDPRIRMR
jgi:hypothetical protein